MKVIAAIFVALLAIQTSTQSPLQDDDTSAKSIIVDVLNTILSITDIIIENVKTVADDFENNQGSITADVETFLAQIGAQVNNLVVNLIDELKEGATDDGLAVLSCIDAAEEATNIAFAQTVTLAGECISDEYPAVLAVVKQILENIQKIESEVKAKVETLDECTSGDALCLLSFVTGLSDIADEIVEIVPSDISDVVALIQEVINHVNGCDLLGNVKSNAQTLFNDVVDCIKK